MKDHPLFNDDENDIERRARDIGFINIHEFKGGKRVTLPQQYEPEELTTAECVFNAVGYGRFELVGRDSQTKRVVDRVLINLDPPKGEAAPPKRADPPASPPPAAAAPAPFPAMQVGGMVVPANMDPSLAMFLAMATNQTQMLAQMLVAQREDSKIAMASNVQLMLGMSENTTRLITGLAGALGGRPNGGPEGAAEAFIKGVETMGSLMQGVKEGNAETEGKPTDWGEIAKSVVESVKTIRDISQMSATGAPPVVPPGTGP